MLILIGMYIGLTNIFIPKDRNYQVIKNFAEEKENSLDVLTIGSCHAYTSYNPIYIWQNGGISSYNNSYPSGSIPMSYFALEESLKVQKPEVVFIESWGINTLDTYIERDKMINYFVNYISKYPLSKEKTELLTDYYNPNFNELVNGNKKDEQNLNTELLANFLPLNRFKERLHGEEFLNEGDFNNTLMKKEPWERIEIETRNANKGYSLYPADGSFYFEETYTPVLTDETLELNEMDKVYIDKIISLCEKNGAEVVFYQAPYRNSEIERMRFNYLEQYLEQKNVQFLKIEENVEIDYANDFFDENHLNINGANKVSQFLLDFLQENYDIEDKRNDDRYRDWNKLNQ